MTTKKSQACGLKSWVFGYASLHGNGVSLNFKKSKGLQVALCFKNVRACLPLGQQHRNANASSVERQLSQTNNSSVNPFWATQAPASRSTLPRSAHKSRRFQEAVE